MIKKKSNDLLKTTAANTNQSARLVIEYKSAYMASFMEEVLPGKQKNQLT